MDDREQKKLLRRLEVDEVDKKQCRSNLGSMLFEKGKF